MGSKSDFHEYKLGSKWAEDTKLVFEVDDKGNLEARVGLNCLENPEAEKAVKEFSNRITKYLADH